MWTGRPRPVVREWWKKLRKNDRFDNNIYPFYYISHGLSYYLPFLQKQKKPGPVVREWWKKLLSTVFLSKFRQLFLAIITIPGGAREKNESAKNGGSGEIEKAGIEVCSSIPVS